MKTDKSKTRPNAVAPLRSAAYRRYFTGQSVSFLGDGVVPVTFALAVLKLTHAGWGMPLVLLGLWLSRTVFIAFGGSMADRRNRASIMLIADVVRLAAQLGIAFAFAVHKATIWEVVASAVVYGAATAFFAPSSVGLLPRLVPREHLQRANALLGTARNAGLLVGPAAAALMVTTGGVQLALWFDAGTFAISVLCLSGLRGAAAMPPAKADAQAQDTHSQEEEQVEDVRFRAALPTMLRLKAVIWIVGVWCVSQIGVASLNVLGPIISNNQLGGANRWAVLVTSMAVGGLAGSAFGGSLVVKRPAPVILALLAVPMPLQLVALAVPVPLPLLACSFVATSAALAICGVLFDTYLQNTVPDDMLARVSSAESGLTSSMIPIGLAICLPLADLAGFRSYLIILAALLVSAATTGALVTRRVHDRSAAQEPSREFSGAVLAEPTRSA
jgi:MFS family permease